MPQVNMLEAKTNLSKLVEAVESGAEKEIILARNGRPVARLVPIELPSRIMGIADGAYGEFDYEGFQALDLPLRKAFEARTIHPTYEAATRKRRKKSA